MKLVKRIFIIQLVILVYALSSIPSKLTSQYEFLSMPFIMYYAVLVFVLAVYAILWQQVLKHNSLTIAYLNKSTSIIWIIIIGYFIFNESITLNNIIGCALVITGIIIMTIDGDGNTNE